MPKYHYTILEPSTKQRRTGALEAPDYDQALTHLVSRGQTVVRLREIKETSLKMIGPEPTTPGHRTRPRYRPTLAEMLAIPRLSDRTARRLLSAGTVLGLLLMGLTGISWESSPSSTPPLLLQLEGELRLDDGSRVDPAEVQVTLGLPQVPLRKTWKGADVLDGRGGIKLRFEVPSARPPGYADVRIEKDGYEPLVLEKLSLHAVDGAVDVPLGKLTLSPKRLSQRS